jgi:hypothetical protein
MDASGSGVYGRGPTILRLADIDHGIDRGILAWHGMALMELDGVGPWLSNMAAYEFIMRTLTLKNLYHDPSSRTYLWL